MPRFNKIIMIPLVFALTGCSVLTSDLTLSEQLDLIEKDIKSLYTPQAIEDPISFDEAIARTIKYNLDNRVKALETVALQRKVTVDSLGALPRLNASADYSERDNFRASSSRSVETGRTSLEPSYGSERHIGGAKLEASWDLIESGLNVVNAKNSSDEAKIAHQRQRKMAQGIVREVLSLYWQAASEQILRKDYDGLIQKGKRLAADLQRAEEQGLIPQEDVLKQQAKLYKSLNALSDAKERLLSAKVELAYLMNLPPNTDFSLEVSDRDFQKKIPSISNDVDELVLLSVVMRPESREEVLRKRIEERKSIQEILKTLPGFEIIASQNYNSNDFLVNKNWGELSLSLTQNLLSIFTLPSRLNKVETEQRLADLKRQTLMAAIMTQTHIAYNSFEHSREKYNLRRRLLNVEQQIARDARNKFSANSLSDVEYFEIQTDFILGQTDMHNSFVRMWSNYAMLIDTLGIDPTSDITTQMSLEELEAVVKDRYGSLNEVYIPDALDTILAVKKVPLPQKKPAT